MCLPTICSITYISVCVYNLETVVAVINLPCIERACLSRGNVGCWSGRAKGTKRQRQTTREARRGGFSTPSTTTTPTPTSFTLENASIIDAFTFFSPLPSANPPMGSNGDLKGTGRRPSASLTPFSSSSSNSNNAHALQPSASASGLPSSSARVHRSNDSHHGFVGSHPATASPLSFSPAPATGSPQSKAVLALIKRLTAKVSFKECFLISMG